MNPRLVEYYNRELAYLRELGAEFAAAFPKVAGRLALRDLDVADPYVCLLYTSPSPRDLSTSRMPSSA